MITVLTVFVGIGIFLLYGIGCALDKIYEALSEIRDELKKLADKRSQPPNV
jgi:hypothetical protein